MNSNPEKRMTNQTAFLRLYKACQTVESLLGLDASLLSTVCWHANKNMTNQDQFFWLWLLISLVLVVSIAVDAYETHESYVNSPLSPTVAFRTEWVLCSQLGLWAFGWRSLLNIMGLLFSRVILMEDFQQLSLLRRVGLAPAAWFVYGSILMLLDGKRCSIAAPEMWGRVMGNYVAVSVAVVIVAGFTALSFLFHRLRHSKTSESSGATSEKGFISLAVPGSPVAAEKVELGHLA